METFKYRFTIIEKDKNRVICKKTTDVLDLKKYLPEFLFEYVRKQSRDGRLTAKKLIHMDRICFIERIVPDVRTKRSHGRPDRTDI